MRNVTSIFLSISLLLALFCFKPAHGLKYDFENRAQFDDWEVIDGDWKIADGQLNGKQGAKYVGIVLPESEKWTDFTVKADVTRSSGTYTYFVVRFSKAEPLTTYLVEVTTENLKVWKEDAGAGANLSSNPLPDAAKWLGTLHKFQIDVKKDQIDVYIDGKKSASVNDKTFSKGKFGLGGYNSENLFDNLEFTGPGIFQAVKPTGKLSTTWANIKRQF
ncbi:DUF1080 domain-containing protein [Candidatus Poribacteria bacterium]|nr:DUF1080 domain-containing protein [Candidatus Poribacteria bacterium]